MSLDFCLHSFCDPDLCGCHLSCFVQILESVRIRQTFPENDRRSRVAAVKLTARHSHAPFGREINRSWQTDEEEAIHHQEVGLGRFLGKSEKSLKRWVS